MERRNHRRPPWGWMEGERGDRRRPKWKQGETVGEQRTTFPASPVSRLRWARSPEREPSSETVRRSIVSWQREIPAGSQVTPALKYQYTLLSCVFMEMHSDLLVSFMVSGASVHMKTGEAFKSDVLPTNRCHKENIITIFHLTVLPDQCAAGS